MPHEMRLIDAVEGLRSLEPGSVGLIVTDPAYASLEKWRDMGTTTRLKKSKMSSNPWFPTVPNDYFGPFFAECYRVLANDTHMYVMCDEETSEAVKPMVRAAGFSLRKSLIWHKVGNLERVSCPKCGTHVCDRRLPGTPGMGYPYRSVYEMILHAEKGKRKPPEDRSVRNVLENPWIEETWIKSPDAYPTEKPVGLCRTLIRTSSKEGDLVVDPFAGSGSTGEAAFELRRDFLGFDVVQEALNRFEERRQHWTYDDPKDAPRVTGGILDLFGEPRVKHFVYFSDHTGEGLEGLVVVSEEEYRRLLPYQHALRGGVHDGVEELVLELESRERVATGPTRDSRVIDVAIC